MWCYYKINDNNQDDINNNIRTKYKVEMNK